MTAGENHILTIEMERYQRIFEMGDGVTGADPLTIIYSVALSILILSYYNSSSIKDFTTAFLHSVADERSCPPD